LQKGYTEAFLKRLICMGLRGEEYVFQKEELREGFLYCKMK